MKNKCELYKLELKLYKRLNCCFTYIKKEKTLFNIKSLLP
jgi:hypothetical protein